MSAAEFVGGFVVGVVTFIGWMALCAYRDSRQTHGMNRPAEVKDIGLRSYWARRDVCPECGGELDTGWECNACGYDAGPDAQPDRYPVKER